MVTYSRSDAGMIQRIASKMYRVPDFSKVLRAKG